MKRIAAFILCAAMLAGALSACGREEDGHREHAALDEPQP